MKHLLAANILPMLAEQFDDVMKEYLSVRRESQEGYCSHTAPTESAVPCDAAGSSKESDDKVCDEDKTVQAPDIESNQLVVEDDDLTRDRSEESDAEVKSRDDVVKDKDFSKSKLLTSSSVEDSCHGPCSHGAKLTVNTEIGIYSKPTSPGACTVYPSYSNSVSCSPTSYQSSTGSGQNSPTWSPAQNLCESPACSPPSSGFVSGGGHCPWESPTSSRQPSPSSSPSYFPPWLSPPRSASPIRAPSDWEYEDDDVDKSYESGRFSPVITKAKDAEETEDETDDLEEGDATNTEEINTEDDSASADEGVVPKGDGTIEVNMKKMLVISSTSQKRYRDTCSPSCSSKESSDPMEKKIKMDSEVCSATESDEKDDKLSICDSVAEVTSRTKDSAKEGQETSSSSSEKDRVSTSADSKSEHSKSPFIRLNEIKFRVRNRPRRQLTIDPEDKSVITQVMEEACVYHLICFTLFMVFFSDFYVCFDSFHPVVELRNFSFVLF